MLKFHREGNVLRAFSGNKMFTVRKYSNGGGWEAVVWPLKRRGTELRFPICGLDQAGTLRNAIAYVEAQASQSS